jgi:hypothetical protein
VAATEEEDDKEEEEKKEGSRRDVAATVAGRFLPTTELRLFVCLFV